MGRARELIRTSPIQPTLRRLGQFDEHLDGVSVLEGQDGLVAGLVAPGVLPLSNIHLGVRRTLIDPSTVGACTH
jgi:hypothetical protein